jgi:hypothetical protein
MAAVSSFALFAVPAFAANQVRISQVYGGGGGSTGTYLRDYVEIFNSGGTAVNIGGWTLEYGSATGNWGSSSGNIFTFPANTTIQPYQFLLVEAGSSGTAGTALPVTADFSTATTGFSMSGTSGKVALFSTGTGNANVACGAEAAGTLVDKVSYGTANCAEGAAVPALTTTTGAIRRNDGCMDTDNNVGDFIIVTNPVPRNSTSFNTSCGGNAVLNPPVMSSIADQSLPRNGATPAIPFLVTDGETAPDSLVVAATGSTDSTLLPLANIVLNSSGNSNRTVTITPAVGQQGFSQVTLTVTDGDGNTATRTFLVIVGSPTLAPISNVDTVTNAATSVSLLVGDPESDSLTFDAISTNSTLIPVETLLFSGSGSNRTLSITPSPDQAGVSRITVLVSDGHNTVSNSFLVTVAPKIGLVFSDEFNYPDGPLVSGSSFVWNTHSGSNDQMRVVSGRIFVTSTNSEDVSAFLGVNSFPPGGGWVLYSSFTADFKRLPTSTDYFAHFKNASISFGARIYATTNGAAPGKLRLGIANAGGTPSVIFPVDLDTNVTHTVVCRYNVGTGQSRLWVNPASEASASVTATDTAFPFEVFTYSFRESTGIGDIYVDSLKVGTSFADVLTVRPSLVITRTGSAMTLTWPASAAGYVLRFTQAFPSLWADHADQGTVVGDNKVVTIPNPTGTLFFQLRQP